MNTNSKNGNPKKPVNIVGSKDLVESAIEASKEQNKTQWEHLATKVPRVRKWANDDEPLKPQCD